MKLFPLTMLLHEDIGAFRLVGAWILRTANHFYRFESDHGGITIDFGIGMLDGIRKNRIRSDVGIFPSLLHIL